jgi:hypothetical protein
MKNICISLILMILMTTMTFAQFDYGFNFNKAGTSGLQFLKIGLGGKEVGFGAAVSSTVNNAASVFWNPAGLGWMKQKQLFLSHNTWLVGSKHSALSFAMPFNSLIVAVSAAVLSIEEIEETTVLSPTGTGRKVGAGDVMIGIAVAKKFTDKLTIGGQIKYVQEKLDDVTFNSILFDIGTIYFTGFRDLRLAFTLQHFGADQKIFDQKFKMPLLFRVGAADYIIKGDRFQILTAVDLIHPTDNNEWVNWGIEVGLLKTFALRGGYRFNVDEGALSIGFGIELPLLENTYSNLDYAYVSYGEIFGNTHRFSLSFTF